MELGAAGSGCEGQERQKTDLTDFLVVWREEND
jgi:hypothetical protein